jgi:hypothetical protein
MISERRRHKLRLNIVITQIPNKWFYNSRLVVVIAGRTSVQKRN